MANDVLNKNERNSFGIGWHIEIRWNLCLREFGVVLRCLLLWGERWIDLKWLFLKVDLMDVPAAKTAVNVKLAPAIVTLSSEMIDYVTWNEQCVGVEPKQMLSNSTGNHSRMKFMMRSWKTAWFPFKSRKARMECKRKNERRRVFTENEMLQIHLANCLPNYIWIVVWMLWEMSLVAHRLLASTNITTRHHTLTSSINLVHSIGTN